MAGGRKEQEVYGRVHPWRGLARAAGQFGLGWCVCALFLLLCAVPRPRAAEAEPFLLTKAHQVHELPAGEAAKGLPVHLLATVTFYQPREVNFFVADSSGGVFILQKPPYPFSIHVGDRVEVDGVTAASFRTIVGAGARVRVVAHGRPAAARPAMFREMVTGELDCQRVSIRGRVRSATVESHETDTVAQLQVLVPGGIVQAYVQHYEGLDLPGLIDADVELSGVAGADFNEALQLMRPKLYSDDAGDVRVLGRPRLRPLELPITAINKVMETRFVMDQSRRVRVQGAVTFFEPGNSLVVERDGRSILALTRQTGALALGSVVDVVGFADGHAYSAVLEDAQFFPAGYSERVDAQPASYAEAMSGKLSDTFIAMRGRVLSEMRGELSDSMVMMVDQHPVSVVMQRKGRAPLPDLKPGTLVAVRGICRVTPSAWGRPLLFRLDLRSAGDLKVMACPSWWTSTHLMLVGSGLLGAMALTLGWIAVLRRRVAKQTGQIARSMRVERERSRLLERINSDAAIEELLSDICRSISLLVPGASCSYTLRGEHGRKTPTDNGSAMPVYEAALMDARGRQVGAFRVEYTGAEPLPAEQRETLAVGASLANLAVNQRQLYAELNYQSTHDQLTALPNRRLADARLEEAIAEAGRTGARVGVAYIDVDQFKQVNDRHGHKIGDLYLQQIAGRLGRSVRGSDLLARIGGDEFLLVAGALGSLEDGEAYQRRLAECFENGFVLDGIRVRGSASIGFALFPDHGSTPEELKRHADAAMYRAKHGGDSLLEQTLRQPGRVDIFSPADLRSALEGDRFRLFYQPQFSSAGRLRGLEALLRLNDPILGIVGPDQFIGVAESSNVIFPLGEWVLRRALADAARWGIGAADGTRMVVNVSARQVERAGFADLVGRALAESGVCASTLEIEITERAAISDMGSAGCQLAILQAEGVHISIDDFGTEHSSLSVLHKLPVDTLKIDRSFVRAMGSEPEVVRVLDAIVHLGQSLGKRIIAEGVECEQEVRTLLELGEMDLQGYVFSRPVPPETVESKLEGWRRQEGVGEVCAASGASASEIGRVAAHWAAAPLSDQV